MVGTCVRAYQSAVCGHTVERERVRAAAADWVVVISIGATPSLR
jgi:hypothetical protein